MRENMRKTSLVAFLLIFSFLLSSCAGFGGFRGSNLSGGNKIALKDLDFDGEVFMIHTSINVDADQQASYNSSNYLIQGAEELEGDKASDSALQRNLTVAEDLNIVFRYIESDYDYTVSGSEIRGLIQAGADGISLIINDLGVTRLSAEGLFHDATYGEFFDFSQPYWYDGLMESASLNTNTRFMLAGDYFMDVTRHSHCLLMNKDYYRQLGGNPEAIYTLVDNGGWTLDALISIINGGKESYNYLTGKTGYTYNGTYIDSQGNQRQDGHDRWGIAMHGWWGTIIPFLTTSDPGYISRDEKGYPIITVNNERTVSLAEKLTTLYHTPNSAVQVHGSNDGAIGAFVAGRVLFLTYQRLGSLESNVFSSSELNMAILPYPKLDDLQPDYISTIHDTTEVGYIPSTISFANLRFVSAVVEYLSQMTSEIVMPKYYESTLKVRYSKNPDNARMIQIIHDHYGNAFPFVWDVGDKNIFTTGIYESVYKNNPSVASIYRSFESSAQSDLEDYISDYEYISWQLEQQYAGN